MTSLLFWISQSSERPLKLEAIWWQIKFSDVIILFQPSAVKKFSHFQKFLSSFYFVFLRLLFVFVSRFSLVSCCFSSVYCFVLFFENRLFFDVIGNWQPFICDQAANLPIHSLTTQSLNCTTESRIQSRLFKLWLFIGLSCARIFKKRKERRGQLTFFARFLVLVICINRKWPVGIIAVYLARSRSERALYRLQSKAT